MGEFPGVCAIDRVKFTDPAQNRQGPQGCK